MLLIPRSFLIVAIIPAMVACNAGRRSSAGFHLPDGDVQRGQVAFVEKGCYTCHEVSGVDTPKPTVQPVVPVVLGGSVTWHVTDGYLTTSIINPSYALARYPKAQITENNKSRMPHYQDNVTVRELTDIVAFLQAHYTEVPPMPTNGPY
jgi:mono/diheme cytochrome c family protein